jgi:nucleoside-triphosphatase THEP1
VSQSPTENLMLTGPPDRGKTTMMCLLVEQLAGRRLAGFFTQEIRHKIAAPATAGCRGNTPAFREN